MKRVIFFLLFTTFGYLAYSQSFMRPNEWKKYKREVFVTIGSSHFLGDLGGSADDASHYSPKDLNFNQTRIAVGFGGRYKLKRNVNVAGKFSFLNVKGDDAATENIYRQNRNLNFKANVFELTGRIEGGYQSTKRGGNRYGIRKNYGRMKAVTHNIFAFVGAGVFYFNPKGQTAEGDWINLYGLHTEGQGLPGGPKQYSRVSFSIPVGGYYKFTWNKIWSIGIEFSYRKTFTDYLDDVGSNYYDPVALGAAYGPVSVQMADPNLGNIPGASKPAADGTPAVRGNNQKDAFISVEIMGSYIFKKQRKSYRLRSKF